MKGRFQMFLVGLHRKPGKVVTQKLSPRDHVDRAVKGPASFVRRNQIALRIRILLSNRPQAVHIRFSYRGARFNLDCGEDLPAARDEEIYFCAGVGSPEKEVDFPTAVAARRKGFEHQELFKTSTAQPRVRTEHVAQRIGNTDIEEAITGMGDQTFAHAARPRVKTIRDERVLQNLVVALHGFDGHTDLSCHVARVDDFHVGCGRNIKKSGEGPNVADGSFLTDFLAKLGVRVGAEELALVRGVKGTVPQGRQRAYRKDAFQVKRIAQLFAGERK